MNRKLLSVCCSISPCLFSCNGVKRKEAKQVVETFYTAYKSEDFKTMYKCYPQIASLKGNFRKTTRLDINEDDIWVLKSGKIIVNAEHHWINPYGSDNVSSMRFYLEKKSVDNKDTYQIYDSKNFCMYDDSPLYTYAHKTGCLSLLSDTTDVTISDKIDKVTDMFEVKKARVRKNITDNLKLSSFDWERSHYGDSASGRGVVTNNSKYPVYQPKYKITYRAQKNGNVITMDDGVISYGTILPSESKSFVFYTSYIGNAHWARVDVNINDESDEWIEKLILKEPFLGTEYSTFERTGNVY